MMMLYSPQMMGHAGRNLERKRAEIPLVERTMMAPAFCSIEAATADMARVSAVSVGRLVSRRSWSKRDGYAKADSARYEVSAMTLTTDVSLCTPGCETDYLPASMGYLPLAVSPDNMTQSAPSRTALATSEISARVGRGLFYKSVTVNDRRQWKLYIRSWTTLISLVSTIHSDSPRASG